MKKSDDLEASIEKGLTDLLSGKSTKTADDKEELRRNILLAIKWQAVKLKKSEGGWGSGFKNGQGDADDVGLDDD